MQKIHLISTGGTIEKVYSEATGTVSNLQFKLDRYLSRLRLPDAEVDHTQLMNKDSLDMDDADRLQVLRAVERKLPDGVPIVISHGTDTMVDTGLLLQASLKELKVPVIFTGAMVPLGFENSDALQNLTESLIAARLLAPGGYVVMHNQVFPVDLVRKDRDLG